MSGFGPPEGGAYEGENPIARTLSASDPADSPAPFGQPAPGSGGSAGLADPSGPGPVAGPGYPGGPGYAMAAPFPPAPAYPGAPPGPVDPNQAAAGQYPGYPGYPYPAAYPYMPGYAPTNGTNGLSIAALVCGICGFIYGIPAILGIVFGCIGLSQAKRNGQQGRGMAIAGIVVGAAWVLLWVIVIIALIVFVNSNTVDVNNG